MFGKKQIKYMDWNQYERKKAMIEEFNFQQKVRNQNIKNL